MTLKLPIVIPAQEGESALLFHFFREDGEIGFTREVRKVIGWFSEDSVGDEIVMIPLLAGYNRTNSGLNRRVAYIHQDGSVSSGREDFVSIDAFIDNACRAYQAGSIESAATH